jgi:hypothetical protein
MALPLRNNTHREALGNLPSKETEGIGFKCHI